MRLGSSLSTAVILVCALGPPAAWSQRARPAPEAVPEVRQLVTFQFLPGKTAEAIRLFETEALPLYRENPPMLRFRGFREVESPVPLDLIVVSSFSGMAGMDASNGRLRESAEPKGAGSIYARIAALSQSHHDQFVEMDASLAWGDADAAPLRVFQSLRLTPGSGEDFDALLRERVLPWERELGGLSGSETGRFVVSDGWHVLRVLGIQDLGGWHRYWGQRREQSWANERSARVAESLVRIVAPVPELSVR